MAEAYQPRLTLDEAKEISDFYRSNIGRKIIAAQANKLGTPNPPIPLADAERAEAVKFGMSPGGQAFQRANKDPTFFPDLGRIIQRYLRENP
jgi:hypothetical protein